MTNAFSRLGKTLTQRDKHHGVLKKIFVDSSVDETFYDDSDRHFIFETPNVKLRVESVVKSDFEEWKKNLISHKYFIQFLNSGRKDGLNIPSVFEDAMEQSEDTTSSHASNKMLPVNCIKNSDEDLTIKALCSEIKIITKEMREVIQLIFSTATDLNLKIIRLEQSDEELKQAVKIIIPTFNLDLSSKSGSSISDCDQGVSNNELEPLPIKETSKLNKNFIEAKSEYCLVKQTVPKTSAETDVAAKSKSFPRKVEVAKCKPDGNNNKPKKLLPAIQAIAEPISYTTLLKAYMTGYQLPMFIYEPISTNQLMCAEAHQGQILNETTILTDPIERLLKVIAFAITGHSDFLIPGRRKAFVSYPEKPSTTFAKKAGNSTLNISQKHPSSQLVTREEFKRICCNFGNEKEWEVMGELVDSGNKVVGRFDGDYKSVIKYAQGSRKLAIYKAADAKEYNENFYYWNKFLIGLNYMAEAEIPHVRISDSRLRADIRSTERGSLDLAHDQKIVRRCVDLISVEVIISLVYFGLVFAKSLQSPWIYQKICAIYYVDGYEVDCDEINNGDIEDEIQKRTAEWHLYTSLCYLLPALFCDTLLGAYGDKYGRKINILLGICGMALSELGYLLTLSKTVNTPYWSILIFTFFTGFSSFTSLIPASCNAFLADNIRDTNVLTIRSGILSIFQLTACSLGGVLAGMFNDVHIATAIDIELTLHLIAFMLTMWKIPQLTHKVRTFSIEPNTIVSEVSTNNESFKQRFFELLAQIKMLLLAGWRTYTKKRSGNKRTFMWISAGALMISYTTSYETRVSSVMNSYVFRRTDNDSLDWDAERIGYWNGVGFISILVGTFIGIFIFKKLLKFQETTLIIISIASSTCRVFLIAFASSDVEMYIANVTGCFAGLIQPATVSFISQLISIDEVGRAFSLFGIGSNIAFIVVNLTFTLVYRYTVSWMPGFLFLFIGCIQIIFLIANIWVHYQSKHEGIESLKNIRRTTDNAENRPRFSIDIASALSRHQISNSIKPPPPRNQLSSLKKALRSKISPKSQTNQQEPNAALPSRNSLAPTSINDRRPSFLAFY
uniref:Non-specific serine/threonine protein kinase n=1 Tax=Rhabditophanes sp. KR3021 TaxID=114890 RepID=A0AC35TWT7_9BILA